MTDLTGYLVINLPQSEQNSFFFCPVTTPVLLLSTFSSSWSLQAVTQEALNLLHPTAGCVCTLQQLSAEIFCCMQDEIFCRVWHSFIPVVVCSKLSFQNSFLTLQSSFSLPKHEVDTIQCSRYYCKSLLFLIALRTVLIFYYPCHSTADKHALKKTHGS